MDLERDTSIKRLGSQFASKTRANLTSDSSQNGGGCGHNIILLIN